jgi:CheY-like chemotaxis protein
MGGEIVARSAPGAGTQFNVRIMLTEASQAPAPASQHPIIGYEGRPRTVLLIDDDSTHLDIVQNLLTSLGFAVFTAPNGKAGIELAKQCKPDLTLIDISMPDLSGWQVAGALRDEPPSEHLRIIMVSANAHEFTQGGENEVHDAFVMKPINVQGLLDAIANVLHLEWVHEQPTQAAAVESESAAVHALSSAHIAELYQLGRIGHVRGIQAKLKEIERENPVNAALAAHLRQMIDRFEFKRYMSALQEVRSIDEASQCSSTH